MKRLYLSLWLLGAACVHEAAVPSQPRLLTLTSQASNERDDDSHGGSNFTTFENFDLGAINGQRDWQSYGGTGAPADPAHTRCAIYDHEIADVSAVLGDRSRFESFARQSLRISNAVTTGCYGDQTFSSRANDVAGEAGATSLSRSGLVDYALAGAQLKRHFEAEWSFASAVPNAQQPGLEVVASPARGDDHRMSWVQMVDLPDGLAVLFAERPGATPETAGAILRSTVARRLDRRRSHTVALTIDFVDGPSNDVVRVYVDDELVHRGTSWENYYHFEVNGAANFGGNAPAVNRLMFRTGSDLHRGIPGDAVPATSGHGFLIDNIRVAAFDVPASAAACNRDGWRAFRDSHGRDFENERDCERFARGLSR